MRIVDVITKKRDGYSLSNDEITEIIHGYTNNSISDYQMAAFLMAVFFRGMTYEETAAMTIAMAESGQMIDLGTVKGIKIDKHSTGGVADTTTLVLAPLVAAAGVPVAKMSGRGLGFTGGTIDKLESIPGFRTTLSYSEFINNLQKYNLALTGQSNEIAPADGKIYALRDVTATVESIPLIASSIMSKKIAAGADKILLDVKVGSGAFMKSLDDAVKLAETMVHIGQIVNRETTAVITSMDEPLGQAVGNSLEIMEAIDVLQGQGSTDLTHVCLTLGAHMLKMAEVVVGLSEGYAVLAGLLKSGAALRKFEEFITAQGGNSDIIQNKDLLPQAEHKVTVYSTQTGFIERINVAQIGHIATLLGAGREYKGQMIDLSAGLVMHCRVGQRFEVNESLATLYTNDLSKIALVKSLLLNAVVISDSKPADSKLILGVIDKAGFHKM